jgi:hypothetical protein
VLTSGQHHLDAATRIKRQATQKVLSALLGLTFTAFALILPPIANTQLADAEKQLEKPVIAVIVALAVVVASAWSMRFAVAVLLVSLVACLIHVGYYYQTTSRYRDARRVAASWRAVPLASGAQGVAENTPDIYGRAVLRWSGDTMVLQLLNEHNGTTQQGFYLAAGSASSSFFFSARVSQPHGGQVVICPLLFGIEDARNYFTFRLHQVLDLKGKPLGQKAEAYQIIPNSPVPGSGFHGRLIDDTQILPYAQHWDVMEPSNGDTTTLSIMSQSGFYRFFVNGRQVFARSIDEVTRNTVAVGTTVLANDVVSDAVCEFTHVMLRVGP